MLMRATDRMFEQLENRLLLTAYYVDDNWVEQVNSAPGGTPGVVEPGDIVKTAPGDSPSISNLVFDTQAFATVQTAADKFFLTGSDTIKVISGVYPDALNLTDSPGAHAASLSGLTIEGAQSGVDARTRSGQPESIITTSLTNTNGQLWYIDPSVSNVTIDGFTFDGNGPATGGVTLLDGTTDSNAARGIVVDGNGVDIKNNIITNFFRRGIQYGRFGTPTGGTVSQNSFDNIGAADELPDFSNSGFAMLAFADPSFVDNNVTNVHNGAYYIQVYPPATAPITVSGNDISALESGITLNETSVAAPTTTITTNNITITNPNGVGVMLWTVGNPLSFTNNTLSTTSADTTGVEVWAGAAGVPVNVTLSGGSISGFATGVHVTNSANVNGDQTPALDTARANLNNVSITMPAGGTGVFVEDTANSDTAVSASFGNGTTINGSSTGAGVSLSGANASLVGDTLASVAFAGFTGTGQFVVLGDGAYAGNELDGTGATYNGVSGGATLTVLDGWAIEDRIKHRLDASGAGTGLVRIRSGNIYVTTDSGSIQRGIDAATAGDDVNVADGTYSLTTAVQVNKQVRLLGRQAGVDARTRTGQPETIVDGSGVSGFPVTDFNVTVSGATIDGFTVQGISGGQAQAGITLASGTHGSKVRNNIIQGNNVGLFLANNSSSSATTISQNLFQDNTAAGSASGHGIYADNFTAGNGMQNVAIQDNKFTNGAPTTNSYAVGLGNTDAAIPFTNLTISGNDVSNSGRGMYFFGTDGSTISGNTIAGATRYAVGIFGSTGTVANSNLSFTGNTFNSNGVGIWVDDDGPGTAYSGTLALGGNNYNTSGSQKSIIDTSTTAIDATGETFNGVLASSATNAQQFVIVDTIVDGVDLPGRGLVRTRAANVFVTPNSFYQDPTYAPSGTTSPDIQRGVDVASDGDTVNLSSGTFTQTNGVIIANKTLTISGEGKGAAGTLINMPTGQPPTYLFELRGSMSGFTLKNLKTDSITQAAVRAESTDANPSGLTSLGTLTVDNVAIFNDYGHGISVDGGSATGTVVQNVVITNSDFEGNGSNAAGALNFRGRAEVSLFSFNGNVTMNNDTMNGTTFRGNTPANTTASRGADFAVQMAGRGGGGGPWSPSGNISLSNVAVTGNYANANFALQRYSTVTSSSFNNVSLAASVTGRYTLATGSGSNPGGLVQQGGLIVDALPGGINLAGFSVNIPGTSRPEARQVNLGGDATGPISLIGASVGGITVDGSTSLGDLFAVSDMVVDGVDIPGPSAAILRAGNQYVTPNSFYAVTGVDSNTYGTTSADIQRAINVAAAGDTVNIRGGTYPSTLTVNKTLTLDGQGTGPAALATLNAKSGSPILTITSTNGTDNVTVRDLAFDGLNGANHAGEGIRTDAPASFGTLTVQRSSFTRFNFDAIAINGDGTNGISAHNLVFSDDNFSNNGSAGGGGTGDISVFQYNGDASFTNLTLTGNAGTNTGEQVAIQFRGVGSGSGSGVLPMGNIALNNIDISGNYVRSMLGIQRYSTLAGLSMNNVALGGATSNITGTFGDLLRFDAAGSGSVSSPATVDLGNTHFRGVSNTSPQQSYLEFAPDNSFAFLHADATNTVWDLPAGGSNLTASGMTTAQAFEAEDRILDYVKNVTGGVTFKGWAELQNGKAFVTDTTVGPISGDSISRAAQVVDSGGTIHIKTGAYTENVDTSSNNVELAPDTGTGQVTINGNLTLDNNDALAILVNGLTAGTDHGQFIVNGTVSLNGAALDTAGSTINATQGQSLTIINNDASDAVNGFFAAPANGNGYVMNINGQPFFVFYNGGDGNDVTLTRAPDGTPEGPPAAPNTVFVDDDWTSNPNGTDTDGPSGGSLGNGTAKGYDEFDNITAALAAVAPGGTIFIYAGNYAESVSVNKAVTFDGEGSGPTPLVNWISNGSSPLVRITSTNASDDVTIRDIAFDGLNGSNQSGEGIRTDAPANFDTLTVQRSTFTHFNFDAIAINGDGVNGVSARNLVFSDDSFSANGSAGGGGTGDISVFQYNGDATFTNLTLTGNAGANTGEQVGIQFRGVGGGSGSGVLPMGNIALNNIDISGSYVRSMIGIQRYTTASTLSMSGVKLGGATSKITGTFGASLRFDLVGQGTLASPATVNLGNTLFRGLAASSAQRHEIEFAPDNNFAFLKADATGTTWTIGGVDVPASSLTLAQAYAVERRILHYVDKLNGSDAYKGFAVVQAGQAFVTDDAESGIIGEGSIERASNVVPSNTGVVHVEAGTYNQLASITNPGVKILGAQAGVDARTRSAVPESILANAAGSLSVAADNVTIDGFTIRDANTGQSTGLYLSPSNSGYQILNNIFTNNTFGMYLNSGGATQTLVRHNLFDSNNQAGPSSGNGIYADQGSKNILVDANKFTGHTNSAMVFAGAPGTQQDITVNNNQLVNDNSIAFFNTTNVDITNNTSTGSTGSVIFIGGGNSDVLITGNIASAAATVSGVNLANPADFGMTANSNVRVIGNSFSGLLNGIRASTGSTSDQLLVQGNTLTGNTNGIRIDGGNAAITANNNIGSNTGAGVLVESSGTASISGNSTPGIHDNFVGVDVNGGTVTLTSNKLSNNTTAVRVQGGGNVTLTSDTFNGNTVGLLAQGGTATITNSHHIDGIGIGNGGLVTVTTNGNTLLVTTSLTVNGTGKLDLNDNDMIVNYSGASQLAAIQALINAGRAGGAWTGNGITSTAAKNNAQHNTTLGAMEATDYQSIYGPGATFDGEALDSTAVLVKYTYYGDTDFNGTVNFDDYVRTDNGFNNHLSGWKNGDFNGDGQVNFDDYVLIDLAFNTQSGTLGRNSSGTNTGTGTGKTTGTGKSSGLGASGIVDGTAAPRSGKAAGSRG